jgi:hypothetical protein
MEETGRYSRRAFLAASLLGGGALVAGGSAIAVRWTGERTVRRLLGLFTDRAALRPVGAAYLKAVPAESDRAKLERLLLQDLGLEARFASPEELGRLVADRIRDDFAEDRVAQVEGWVLSRTEARLCALAALASVPAASPGPR